MTRPVTFLSTFAERGVFNIWAAPSAVAGGGAVPGWLAERIVLTYSQPGDLVLAAGSDSDLVLDAAAAADRAAYPTAVDERASPCWQARATLVVLVINPAHPIRMRWDICRDLLRSDGLFAVAVTDGCWPGDVVSTGDAVGAGLAYLDHVIAVHATIDRGSLRPTRPTSRRDEGLGITARHVPVHSDLFVFDRMPVRAHG